MKKILAILLFILGLMTLSSCFLSAFEEEITVTFVNEGEVISEIKVTQFANALAPALDEAYIPEGYKFFGWTGYKQSEIDLTDLNVKSKYIGPSKMVHYMDVAHLAKDGKVTLNALIISKDKIPVVYHYVVIAWYDKEATSGITEEEMQTLNNKLVAYLKNEGVTDEDIATIIIRPYSGNVGPSCGKIMEDGDVDIMIGWSSRDNVIGTGGMSEEMLLQSESYQIIYKGETKNRMLHRLTDKETAIKVFNWLLSEECTSIFR